MAPNAAAQVLRRVLPVLPLLADECRAVTVTFTGSEKSDFILHGGADVTANPLLSIRSGGPGQATAAAWMRIQAGRQLNLILKELPKTLTSGTKLW